MVREATLDDIPQIVDMGRAFHAASAYASIVAYDAESAGVTFAGLITGEDGVVFVYDDEFGRIVGTTAAMAYPFFFNRHHKTGNEFFWWVDPDHRGSNIGKALLDALEAWKETVNAKSFTLSALESMRPEVVGEIYRRRGYMPSDRSYIKGPVTCQ